MYILIVARRFPPEGTSDGGIFERDQAKALAAMGHKVVYASIDLRSIRRRRKWGMRNFRSDGIDVFEISIPVGAVGKRISDFAGKYALRRLYRLIKAECGTPDIMHAHFLDEAVMAAELSKREGIPLVITEHSSKMNVTDLPVKTLNRAQRAYSSAARLITVSEALREKIKQNTGIDAIVVPNIVDVEIFAMKRESVHESTVQFHFVSTGNLIEIKGYDLLINAFDEVLKKYPDCELKIWGDGSEYKRLLGQIGKLDIADKIQFMGRQAREVLAEDYSNEDAFVLPSRAETFGVAYIEAMASGMPVIATYCGGPEDFVTPENGILVSVNNQSELADAMIFMIEHRSDYNSSRISDYARKRFSPERLASDLTEIYEGIILS